MFSIIILLSVVLRLVNIDQSFWLDEAIGAIAVKNYNYYDLVYKFMPADNHSPLYYILLKFWTSFFGVSEFAIRSMNIFASVFAIFFTYKLSNLLFKNDKLALFACLFLATSQYYVYYTQEARMYGLTSLFSVVSVYFLTLAISNHKKNIYWLGYSLAITGLVFSDYVPVFFLPIIFFYPLFFKLKNKKQLYVKFVFSHLPLLILGVFWLPVFLEQLKNGRFVLNKFPQWKTVAGGASLKNLILVWTKFSFGRISLVNKTIYAAILGLTTLIYLPVLVKAFKHKKLLYLLVSPILVALVASVFFPAFIYFRFTYLYPFFAIMLAAGVFKFSNYLKIYFGFLLICINVFALLTYYLDTNQQREDWKRAVAFIEQIAEPNSIVLFSFSDAPAPYIWYEKGIVEYAGATNSISADTIETVARTNELVRNVNIVYYFEYLRDLSDPNHVVETTLTSRGFEVKQVYGQFKGGVGQIYKWERN